jgi:hypothetical protein
MNKSAAAHEKAYGQWHKRLDEFSSLTRWDLAQMFCQLNAPPEPEEFGVFADAGAAIRERFRLGTWADEPPTEKFRS